MRKKNLFFFENIKESSSKISKWLFLFDFYVRRWSTYRLSFVKYNFVVDDKVEWEGAIYQNWSEILSARINFCIKILITHFQRKAGYIIISISE